MESNKVLATVAGKKITEKDVETLYRGLPPQTAAQLNSEEGRKSLLQELVNQELFYLNALDTKADQEEGFTAELEKLKINLLKQYSINKMLNSIQVDAEEIQSFYEQYKNRFSNSFSVKASHILVDTEEDAEKILKELQQGLSFEEAAEMYSTCPSKDHGGDLGYFSAGKMVPEFEAAAFAMEKDQVSGPVKTQFGYHLIKVTDKKKETAKSFEEIKDQLQRQLLASKQQEAYFTKVEQLKVKYNVNFLD